MKDLWRINDKDGNQIGILKVMVGLDIIDVRLRALVNFGDACDFDNPVFIGTI